MLRMVRRNGRVADSILGCSVALSRVAPPKRILSTSQKKDVPPLRSKLNAKRYRDSKALQRVRLKGELKPMLSLAIQSLLAKKQASTTVKDDASKNITTDFPASVERLAQWNGYHPIDPSRLVVTKCDSGRIDLASGLIAEASPFAAENYIVLARPCQHNQNDPKEENKQQHPPFVVHDYSWYRSLEARIDDNLDRWAENAQKRRSERLASAKQGVQLLFDLVQAPISRAFGSVTARVGPVVDEIRSSVRSMVMPNTEKEPPSSVQDEPPQMEQKGPQNHEIDSSNNSSGISPPQQQPQPMLWNKTEPEDLIILTKDGQTLMLLDAIHPIHRLLALPLVDALASGKSRSKVKPPYRLRMARGGLVITVSLIALGAIAPTYRSLRFILEYPRTAEVVMITLVGSVAYNLWSWRTNAKTRQRELIAAAIQSRLVARNQAAVSFLTEGAVECLTHVVMEDYVSRLLCADEKERSNVDPFVTEIGISLGLLRRKNPSNQGDQSIEFRRRREEVGEIGAIEAVQWEQARSELVHKLATRM